MQGFSDINRTGWVARLPPPVQPWLLLARLDRPIGIWLLFLPGAWGILLARAPCATTLWLTALFATGAITMRAAGCVVNDMWDRDLDRQVARTAGRPLAAGLVTMCGAAVFLALLLGASLTILLQLNRTTQILGVSSLALVAAYPLAKRVTWWPQLVMGFTFGFGAPMGLTAAANAIPPALPALYAATIFWDLGFDTIYGFQDIEDDALAGIKSTSRRFAHAPRVFVGISYTLALLSLAVAGHLAGLSKLFYPALLPAAVHLAWQVATLAPHNPAACLAAFRANRQTGLLIAAAIVAGRL